MINRILPFILFSLFALSVTTGQRDIFWDDNGVELEQDRYRDFTGSPYIFDEFLFADITGFTGTTHMDIPINYNAHTQQFELEKDGKYYLLNRDRYLIISIPRIKNEEKYDWGNEDKILFKRGFHPDFLDNFVQFLYDGIQFKLIREIRQGLDKKTFQDVGKKIEIKRFNTQDRHYLIKDGQSIEIELKEKKLLKVLGEKKMVEPFLKENNLSIESLEGFIKLLEYLDQHS